MKYIIASIGLCLVLVVGRGSAHQFPSFASTPHVNKQSTTYSPELFIQDDLPTLHTKVNSTDKVQGESLPEIKASRSTLLTLPTYEGSGQAVHPDVLYFPQGFQGFSYWMVFTPFPYGQYKFENPSLLASQDGVNWVAPPSNVKTPLVPYPDNWFYNSDPDWLYSNAGDVLLYWRVTSPKTKKDYLKLMTSRTLQQWSEPEELLQLDESRMISPAIVQDNDTFHLWYVDSHGNGCKDSQTEIKYRTSNNGRNWGDEVATNTAIANYTIWHLDAHYDAEKKEFLMLAMAFPKASPCEHGSLFLGKSKNGNDWQFSPTPLLSPSEHEWDNASLYRASFLSQNNELKMWYSAVSKQNEWRIGYLALPTTN